MTEKEIRGKYPPRKLGSQVEFDRIMHEMNTEQTNLNHPLLDRDREFAKQCELLQTQKQAIDIQLRQIHIERIELMQKRKNINRVFYDLKHEFIMLNPRDQYPKIEE